MRELLTTIKRIYRGLASPFRKTVPAKIVTLAPNKLLEGRVAVITGCTSGIGLAIANAFLNAGASVVATGRNKDKLDNIVLELSSLAKDGSKVYPYVLDVTDIDGLGKAVADIVSIVPDHRIDILVNNAGLGGVPAVCESKEYDILMDTNLKSVYFLSKYMAKHMIDNKIEGNILNIVSCACLRPAGSVYGLSKWGVRGITEGFAKMLLPHNIVVNGIGPGLTATPFAGKTSNDDLLNERNPSKRLVTPEEVANIAVVLTSGMGRMIVGDIVYISGGAGVLTCDDIDYNFK